MPDILHKGALAVSEGQAQQLLPSTTNFHFDVISVLRGLLGISIIILVAYAFSSNRKAISWRVVFAGLLIQLLIAFFASIGIQIGGIGSLAPGKRLLLSQYGLRALLAGTLASMLSATMVGMILG